MITRILKAWSGNEYTDKQMVVTMLLNHWFLRPGRQITWCSADWTCEARVCTFSARAGWWLRAGGLACGKLTRVTRNWPSVAESGISKSMRASSRSEALNLHRPGSTCWSCLQTWEGKRERRLSHAKISSSFELMGYINWLSLWFDLCSMIRKARCLKKK